MVHGRVKELHLVRKGVKGEVGEDERTKERDKVLLYMLVEGRCKENVMLQCVRRK